MDKRFTRQILGRTGIRVVQEAKKNLKTAPTRANSKYPGSHIASGNLLSQLGMEIEETPDGLRLVVIGPAYLEELDEGQSGKGVQRESQFYFDATVDEIKSWLTWKGWKPLGIGGRQLYTLEGYAKDLQRKLTWTGVRPTNFISGPIDRLISPQTYRDIDRAYADDSVTLILKQLDNQGWKK